MLQRVRFEPKRLDDYARVAGEEVIEEIRKLADPLRGARVVHINATAFGGGVVEILQTLVPLMQDAGLETDWQVISGTDEFFEVTKACHNGLQGADIHFSEGMRAIWQYYNTKNAQAFEGEYDFVIVHDPQPAGLLHFHGRHDSRYWIWRCHIDTSEPNPAYWDFFAPYIGEYEATIFTMEEYVGPGLDREHVAIIAPTIDPLVPKNMLMEPEQVETTMRRFGLEPDQPLITQVSRFDPWKDPLGVIDAYRVVKERVPGAQLALVGAMAADDPEGWYYLDRTIRHAGEDFDIHVLHNYQGVGAREVGALQWASTVVVQKSIREGFGLVVAEALWKGKPVVGGNAGGIPLQVIDGETGYLVASVEECTEKTLYLLQHPQEAAQMGQAGREHVRHNFTSVRELKDHLRLLNDLASKRT